MLSTPALAQDLPVVLAPRVWRDTRWVGSIAGHATTPDLLSGACLTADHKRSITRICATDARWLTQHPISSSSADITYEPIADDCQIIPLEATHWPAAKLRPSPLNPRGELDPAGIDELAASIAAHAAQGGILQPLLVTPYGTVVAGHRRL